MFVGYYFSFFRGSFTSHENFHPQKLMPIQQRMDQQGVWEISINAAWPTSVLSKLSLCHHCHPADDTFNPRDPLVQCIISSNVLSKEVEKSEIIL